MSTAAALIAEWWTAEVRALPTEAQRAAARERAAAGLVDCHRDPLTAQSILAGAVSHARTVTA